MDILKFKGYEGSAELDMSTLACRGKLLFIGDLVTYEAETPAQLQHEFELAVEDYLETCGIVGKEPQRPFKGLFNVRVSPELHRSAALRAIKDGVFLNDVVIAALGHYLSIQKDESQTKALLTNMIKEQFHFFSTTTSVIQWENSKGVSVGD